MSLELPFLIVVPYKVLSDPNITANAKQHFGCLAVLSKKEGYSWATDQELADMHKVSVRQVKRWHKKLEDSGYIKRISKNIPYTTEQGKLLWKRRRKIYVNDGFSTVCGSDTDVTSIDGDMDVTIHGQGHECHLYKKENTKDKISKEKKSIGASRPPLSSFSVQRLRNIHTTKEEHQSLISKFGEKKTERLYDRLQQWKEDTPRSKWKKSDYRSILRWVVDAVQEEEQKAKKRKDANQEEDNESYAKRIEENYMLVEAPRKKIAIEAKEEGVLIYSTHPTSNKEPTFIRYNEKGFKDLIDSALRKWNLK